MKPPNDVMVRGKKIAGILAESTTQGSILKGVIFGLGVNLNLSNEETQSIGQPATSLYLETGLLVEREAFIADVLTAFSQRFLASRSNSSHMAFGTCAKLLKIGLNIATYCPFTQVNLQTFRICSSNGGSGLISRHSASIQPAFVRVTR